MAAAAVATTTTAAAASLFFPSSLTPNRQNCSVPPLGSSSTCFFTGGALVWGNKKFLQVSISCATQLNKKMSARRFGRAVVVAAADYYSTLGVPKSANSKEIKAAYRKLARQVSGDEIFLVILFLLDFNVI